jgi:hypothetical protein
MNDKKKEEILSALYEVLFCTRIFSFFDTRFFFNSIYKGESNTGFDAGNYTCSFSKMIGYWRQVWNERTNGITDVQFPFGFVQVSFTQKH